MSIFKPEAGERYGSTDICLKINRQREVSWVRGDTPVRVPDPKVRKNVGGMDFTVCGFKYPRLSDLCVTAVKKERRLFQDIHGRYVLDMKERYPIFDSYDAIYESRYYHWYLILEAQRLSLVYSDDGRGGIDITEDVLTLSYKPYSILNFWHYLDENGVLRL